MTCRKAWDSWSALEHRLGNSHAAESLLNRSFAIRFDAQGSFIVLANRLDDRAQHNDDHENRLSEGA